MIICLYQRCELCGAFFLCGLCVPAFLYHKEHKASHKEHKVKS